MYKIIPLALLCTACTPDRPPPAPLLFAGLPVSGDAALAARAGFRTCFNMDAVNVRCRRQAVTVLGNGPYQAAVDLRGSRGQSGFDHLTLWHDQDQRALYSILVSLHRQGWRSCHTGTDRAGDQALFTHPDAPVRISIDISYYAERRLRILPNWKPQKLSTRCVPDKGLGLFNLDG